MVDEEYIYIFKRGQCIVDTEDEWVAFHRPFLMLD